MDYRVARAALCAAFTMRSATARATVHALRSSTTESNNLAEAFRRAVEDCPREGAIDASLTVTGDAQEMHPVVPDEVYRIGYEAIRRVILREASKPIAARIRSMLFRTDETPTLQ